MAKAKVWYENPKGAAPVQGLYSHVGGVTGGTLLFIAGQVAVGAKNEVVGKGDFAAQFRQVFKNLGDVLNGMGCDFSSVIKFTTYLCHSQDIEIFMAERGKLFPKLFKGGAYPPNTLLVIDRLVKEEFLLEVEAVVGAP
ncbi:MAG TPA: RidA family protein [Alphaproteobacteria bacterium]